MTAFVAHGPRGGGGAAKRCRSLPSSCTQLLAKKADATKATPDDASSSSSSSKEPVTTKRKADLIAAVAKSTGMTKSECETCVNTLLDTIVEVRIHL